MRIEFITSGATYALRNQILRPGLPVETVHFNGDDDSGTRHWGAYAGTALVGIVTLMEVPPPPELAGAASPHLRAWQLRGMATAPEVRGQGYGQALVRACLKYVRDTAGQGSIWCNARTSALSFYSAFGFTPYGAQFEIPHGGPHFKMLARVAPTVTLERVEGTFAVLKLAPDAAWPAWLGHQQGTSPKFTAVARTPDELSIVCDEALVPGDVPVQRGWRAARVRGKLDFALTGILASLTEPLARAAIPLFAVSTFDTDYILVSASHWSGACAAWQSAGHAFTEPNP